MKLSKSESQYLRDCKKPEKTRRRVRVAFLVAGVNLALLAWSFLGIDIAINNLAGFIYVFMVAVSVGAALGFYYSSRKILDLQNLVCRLSLGEIQ